MNKTDHDREMIEQSKKIERAYEMRLLSGRGKKLTVKQQEMYDLVKEFPDITSKQIKFVMNITKSTFSEHMEALTIRGRVSSKTGNKGLKSYKVTKKSN